VKETLQLTFIINCCFCTLTSCAQNNKNIPQYDFNQSYDLNQIIKASNGVERPGINKVLEIIKNNTIIGFSWIESPLEQITLIRNNDSLCAIKFTSFKRTHDQKPATTFNSGNESFFAKYEMMTTSLKTNVLDKNISKIIQGTLTRKATIGIGRLAFGGGDFFLECGRAKLYWSFPTAVFIMSDDHKTQFSFTSNRNFNQVDFNSKNNNWYGFEENREIIIINKELEENKK